MSDFPSTMTKSMPIAKSVRSLLTIVIISLTMVNLGCSQTAASKSVRVATFNVSIEATNYLSRDEIAKEPSRSSIVKTLLAETNHSQLQNIAEIIQTTRPDILLLNEFDYIANPKEGIESFIKNYLNTPQNGQTSIDYAYNYIAPVNTGVASPHDLDNDGEKSGIAGDAYGFGYYPGQYGMALLSRYPIQQDQIRSFQKFLWKDMPNALYAINENGEPWYSAEEWSTIRLSSKSQWSIPIDIGNGSLTIIAAHPTPPTFDGNEDRNGKRNHDEIRLINDYIENRSYIFDDKGVGGGLDKETRFVVLGDLNSSPDEGDSIKSAIQNLLSNPRINSSCVPTSKAGEKLRPNNQFASQHTAAWGLRVDYALPSQFGLRVKQCGMFWPTVDDPQHALIASRKASSDHRLVWVDVELE